MRQERRRRKRRRRGEGIAALIRLNLPINVVVNRQPGKIFKKKRWTAEIIKLDLPINVHLMSRCLLHAGVLTKKANIGGQIQLYGFWAPLYLVLIGSKLCTLNFYMLVISKISDYDFSVCFNLYFSSFLFSLLSKFLVPDAKLG